MELRQLQHFVAVAEEMSFTRAARRVNIVQSALSASIRTLEDELDAKLFLRSTRQMRLTNVGRVFLEKARGVIDSVHDARQTVAAMQGLERGTLGIGTVQSLPAFLDLPALLARFHEEHPGMEVRLAQGSSSQLLEKVRSGRLDLAFLPFGETPAGIATTMIACEALVVVCAPDHPFAGRKDVTFSELKNEPFVDFEPDWGTRRLVDRSFSEAGIERRVGFEVSDLDTLLELVAHGLGVAIVPEAIAEARADMLGMALIAGPEICWELVVAYNGGEGASVGPADFAARAFWDLLPKEDEPAPVALAGD